MLVSHSWAFGQTWDSLSERSFEGKCRECPTCGRVRLCTLTTWEVTRNRASLPWWRFKDCRTVYRLCECVQEIVVTVVKCTCWIIYHLCRKDSSINKLELLIEIVPLFHFSRTPVNGYINMPRSCFLFVQKLSGGEGIITYYYKHPVYKMVTVKRAMGLRKGYLPNIHRNI